MNQSSKKIAIVGTGITGLSAAYLLAPNHDITVYEKNDYIGGHSRTLTINVANKNIAVDTGFIVFNYRNYPLLTSLFEHLEVPVAKSNMSFGVSIDNGWLEYSSQNLYDIFAQKTNLVSYKFWRMLLDILRFNRKAKRYLASEPSLTLGQCLNEMGMGKWFRQYFLLAMGSAIWSAPFNQMLEFPARVFIRFFANHGLLTVNNQPQWYTVSGGSREYVKRLAATFNDRIRINCAITKVTRDTTRLSGKEVTVTDSHGEQKNYDEVIFACHSDQALAVIADASDAEQSVLAKMRYQTNRMVLHSDTSFMPKRQRAWSSWIYLSNGAKSDKTTHSNSVCLSYWMNNLQPLATDIPIIITLNPGREPEQELIYDEYWFEHPLFDEQAISAQGKLDSIQGKNQLWFCGAYQRYGFHEDGLISAVNVAEKMGVKPPWI